KIIAKDGKEIQTEINASLIDYQGKPANMAIIRDITKRKQMETALKASEMRNRSIVEVLPDIIIKINQDGEYLEIMASPDNTNKLAKPKEELLGKRITDIFPENEAKRIMEAIKISFDTHTLQIVEYELIVADGRLCFEARIIPSSEKEAFALIRDITEQKKAEAGKRELERKAQVTSRLASIGEMASGIAHEINNPLTSVVGFSELLMEKELPEDLRKDVEIIHSGSQRAADIVKRLLIFARQHKPERTNISINEIIASTLALRKYALETSNIEVETRLDSGLPWTVADAGQLQQVFLNIIVNA
ncbi:MAG: histidine kinase dimerization/phospho-acceptor domain-containing protein, partial [Dehalococcoidales bacterium]|nr:histidine kinase dimerization/phospho-acceptor domain-containing protein [Dehalococcoidales bacterium]